MSSPTGDREVLDLAGEHRFVIRRGGQEAELVYRVDGDRLLIVHTEVPDAMGGQGVGGRLMSAAVTRAATDGLTVVPWCPFARRFLRQHPDQAATVRVDWSPPPATVLRHAPIAPVAPEVEEGRRPDVDGHVDDLIDEQEKESFPASDPHSDWAGAD